MLANNVQKLDHRLEQVFQELGNDLDPKMIDALTKLAREIRESLKYMMEFKGKLVHKRQDTIRYCPNANCSRSACTEQS